MRGRSRFQHVFRTGRRRTHGGITVIRAAGPPGTPRVGVVAGRRVGNAVERNRVKRRLRAAVDRTPLEVGHDYIVVATSSVLDVPFRRLVEWLARAIEEEQT